LSISDENIALYAGRYSGATFDYVKDILKKRNINRNIYLIVIHHEYFVPLN
jgi:hypothetical protein